MFLVQSVVSIQGFLRVHPSRGIGLRIELLPSPTAGGEGTLLGQLCQRAPVLLQGAGGIDKGGGVQQRNGGKVSYLFAR